jgi:hypothetical protein
VCAIAEHVILVITDWWQWDFAFIDYKNVAGSAGGTSSAHCTQLLDASIV